MADALPALIALGILALVVVFVLLVLGYLRGWEDGAYARIHPRFPNVSYDNRFPFPISYAYELGYRYSLVHDPETLPDKNRRRYNR